MFQMRFITLEYAIYCAEGFCTMTYPVLRPVTAVLGFYKHARATSFSGWEVGTELFTP